MNFSRYTELLCNTILFNWKMVVLIIPLCLAPEVIYTRKSMKLTKNENKLFQSISTAFICILIFFVIHCLSITIPIAKDVIGECYLSVHGEYIIEKYSAVAGTRSKWIIMTTDEGNRVAVGYPYKGEELIELPKSGGVGTMWYSENSTYILEFIPDEPTDAG